MHLVFEATKEKISSLLYRFNSAVFKYKYSAIYIYKRTVWWIHKRKKIPKGFVNVSNTMFT